MANTVNIYSESGGNMIGDDSTPTFTFEGTSSGEVLKLQNAGGTGVALSVVSTPTTSAMIRGTGIGADVQVGGTAGQFKSTATTANVLDLSRTVVGSVTVALVKVTSSTPSGALLEFGVVDKGVVSTASAGATVDFGIRVKIGNSYGWIPVYHDVDVD